ncbi:putative gustatory receptor 36a [Drosophila serrata]|uniref:putative gustatory receptor 36a n=1 Tax=Drosophila serrata TaxID=7274 RepID=UPI000A1D2815|nr:putative gustatory receptor 36a [Drosophila serrata]
MFDWAGLLLRLIYYYGLAIGVSNFEVDWRTGCFWISAIINLATTQYFQVMLCVRAQYHLLNAELKKVIEEIMNLSYNPSRKGAFMTRCCDLADQLENIAKLQSQLNSIVVQLDAIFGIQKLFYYCCYYVSALVKCYSIYNGLKYGPRELGMNLITCILGYTWSIFFHMDAIQAALIIFQVQDAEQEMIQLLNERTLFASGLDARLEESFESFQLQLIRNRLKSNVLQLFPTDRNSTWSMYASILLHFIYLVQYDLEYFRRN